MAHFDGEFPTNAVSKESTESHKSKKLGKLKKENKKLRKEVEKQKAKLKTAKNKMKTDKIVHEMELQHTQTAMENKIMKLALQQMLEHPNVRRLPDVIIDSECEGLDG